MTNSAIKVLKLACSYQTETVHTH